MNLTDDARVTNSFDYLTVTRPYDTPHFHTNFSYWFKKIMVNRAFASGQLGSYSSISIVLASSGFQLVNKKICLYKLHLGAPVTVEVACCLLLGLLCSTIILRWRSYQSNVVYYFALMLPSIMCMRSCHSFRQRCLVGPLI